MPIKTWNIWTGELVHDPNLIRSLEQAVQGAPGDQSLRLHLAGMLLGAGSSRAALDHCLVILSQSPNSPEALGIAYAAAVALDEEALAASLDARLKSVIDAPIEISDEALQALLMQDTVFPPVALPAGGQAPAGSLPARITFQDVGGMEEVKRRLNSAFLAPLKNPDLRKAFNKSLRGGLLLYGPPGCGKTFIARAVAGELGAAFVSVGLSDILDMWVGSSERNLHEVFESARRAAPCVLFLDEIDALGQKRSHLRYSASRGVVNQLLSEMDGTAASNEGVFVLAASNHPWDIDTALKRPGRLDRSILVLPPDQPARVAILRYHFSNRPTAGLDLEKVARQTEGLSGADLAYLAESATELAFEDSVAAGQVRSVTMKDVSKALRGIRPSTLEWLEMAKNFAMFSNTNGVYDELLIYLKERKVL